MHGSVRLAVSITQTVSLPAQPTAPGTTVINGLGGNGKVAPHNEFLVTMVESGDATGGRIDFVINLDPRYSSLLSMISCNCSSVGATFDWALTLSRADGASNAIFQGVAGASSSAIANTHAVSIVPPPILLAAAAGQQNPQITFQIDNLDGIGFNFSAQIYTFVKNVREITPLGTIFSVLPRGLSFTPPA